MSTPLGTASLSATGVRMLAAAPHRLLFFVGASNVLLAMLWWALWLIGSFETWMIDLVTRSDHGTEKGM